MAPRWAVDPVSKAGSLLGVRGCGAEGTQAVGEGGRLLASPRTCVS